MIQTLQIVNTYEEEAVYQAICKSFQALEVEKDLHPRMRVVLKPNLVMAKEPSSPVTTHPVVVRAVARWLLNHGISDITLAESSGGLYNAEYMMRIYHVCGMDTLPKAVKLNMDFSSRTVHTDNKQGIKANHSFNIITPVAQADYIINLCKLKTHAMTGFSGGIKNLFGTIPGLEKPQMHYRWPNIEDFSRMLLELAKTVSPQITVIDAIDAMEGNGPTGGTSHPLNMILAARDFYTQDYFAAQLMGIRPEEIVMIRQAVEGGLARPSELKLVGDAVPKGLTPFKQPDTKSLDFTTRVPGFLKKPVLYLMHTMLKSYPRLEADKCIGCGKCAESCPAHIITIRNKRAKFKKRGCIACFCCQEMCPMKAIAVKKSL